MPEVELDWTDDWDDGTDWERLAQGAVEAAFTVLDFAPVQRVSISIKLSDNDEVQALNAHWRGKDRPTNVLSFPMLEAEDLVALIPPRNGEEILLGDIILAHTVCFNEAQEKQIPLLQHVTHLVIHGTLHLFGLDHIDDEQAEHMETLEVKALASLGFDNPY
jgi:probable rRNA maturation factor